MREHQRLKQARANGLLIGKPRNNGRSHLLFGYGFCKYDGTDKGDYSYTMNKTIRVNSATSVAENTSLTQSQITIAPNPTNEESIIVKLSEPSDNAPAYIVTAINGQRIHPLSVTKLSADKVEIRLAKDIANGVYTLTESRSQITSSFIIHR
jgi:hypothetical protein